MSLNNIDDIFSEQPLKNKNDDDTSGIDEEAIRSLKKGFVKKEYDKVLDSKRFSIRKVFRNVKNFFANLDIKYYIRALKVCVIISLFIVTFLLVRTAISRYRATDALEIDISQSGSVTNNSNFIYTNYEFYMDGVTNNLLKIQIDTLNTKFYFENEIDYENFTPVLIDETGKKYLTDTTYVKEDFVEQEVIAFEGLDKGIINFRLVFMYNKVSTEDSDENIYFNFKVDKPIMRTYVKYHVEPFNLANDKKKFDMIVHNATFSSSRSDVMFEITYSGDDIGYDLSAENVAENLYLKEGNVKIPFVSEGSKVDIIETGEHDDTKDKMILGKLSFGVLNNLNSKVEIGFTNFYRVFYPDYELNTKNLLLRELTSAETLELDEYSVYFEGMRKYNDLLVLVAHGEDNTKVDMGNDENNVEIIVDTTLKLTLSDGSVVEIQGEPKHTIIGTDILFQHQEIPNLNSDRMELIVNKIDIIEEGSAVSLNLREDGNQPPQDIIEYTDFVEETLLNRLKYKSNELIYSKITGFSDEVLEDQTLRELYQPEDLSNRANFGVIVDSYAFDSEGHFVCVAYEEWTGKIRNKNYFERNKHYITVEKTSKGLEIVEDEIIEE
ncbi:MAG: hypothetical protein ACK5LV_09480 [Lachnospirales bacterium]